MISQEERSQFEKLVQFALDSNRLLSQNLLLSTLHERENLKIGMREIKFFEKIYKFL